VPVKTWNAGPEHDDAVRLRLKTVLLELGYSPAWSWWSIGGSQEISHWELTGALGNLIVEAETYVGFTITGPDGAVSRVRSRMESQVA
jgi:hypothetical protein